MLTKLKVSSIDKKVAITEVFVTAFRFLSQGEKESIVEKLLDDLERGPEFSSDDWRKIEKITNRKGRIYHSTEEFLKAL
ncbi:MAG: hypothetical protein QME68_08860, partial [Elusimicrobiota bacterium]|nr:hypothetical protein [Elusimicrobiota bacterium]